MHTIELESYKAYLRRTFSPVSYVGNDLRDLKPGEVQQVVHLSHGRGRWGAPIMIVGESPSLDSNNKKDCCSKAFCPGSIAGGWLEAVLCEAGIDSKTDVWITNCIKHFINPNIQTKLSRGMPADRDTPRLLSELARDQREVIFKEIAGCNPQIVIFLGHTALGLVGKSISKAHGEVFIAESIPTKPACYGLYHPSIYCGANRNRFTPQELNDQRCWTIEVLKRAKQDCDVDQATQSVAALNFASWKGGRDQPDQQVDAITAHYGDRDEDDSNCRHETPEIGQMRQMMMRAKISDAAKGSRGPPLMPQPAGSGGYRF